MKYKKIMAVALAATMVMGNSVMAFADEGSTTGSGKLEGTVNTDVFNVVLPTVDEGGSTLAFTLDPEGLIKATSAAAYSGKTFGDGTLFFANTDGTTDYSNTSDTLTVTNKSSVAADVTVTAKITGNDGITLSSDKTFADDTSASMYMAIVDTTHVDGVAITENGATVTAQVGAAPDGAYEYKYADGQYSYALKADLSGITFEEYEFKLTGASNAAGDWSELSSVAPAVEVTWTVVAHQDNAAPSIATTSYTLAQDTPVVVNVSLGAGDKAATGITSLTYTTGSGAVKTIDSASYTFAGGTLTIKSEFLNTWVSAGITSRDIKVTFNDTAATEVTLSLATAGE